MMSVLFGEGPKGAEAASNFRKEAEETKPGRRVVEASRSAYGRCILAESVVTPDADGGDATRRDFIHIAAGAAAVGLAMLVLSFVILLILNAAQGALVRRVAP